MTGLAEMELACLRGGRVFTFVQWKQFELGYLVFRAGQSKMQAIAIEKNKLDGDNALRAILLNI